MLVKLARCMDIRLHEIWVDAEGLEACVLAGREGNAARGHLMQEEAWLIHTFTAGSVLEAMEYYNRYVGREPYVSMHPEQDSAPYADSG